MKAPQWKLPSKTFPDKCNWRACVWHFTSRVFTTQPTRLQCRLDAIFIHAFYSCCKVSWGGGRGGAGPVAHLVECIAHHVRYQGFVLTAAAWGSVPAFCCMSSPLSPVKIKQNGKKRFTAHLTLSAGVEMALQIKGCHTAVHMNSCCLWWITKLLSAWL